MEKLNNSVPEKNRWAEKRFHENLSNGQVLTVKISRDSDGYGDIDIAIGDSKEHADEMTDDYQKGFDVSSGRCGLEGLIKALNIITSLDPKDFGGILFIQPSDAKRASAYRRLLKYGWIWNPENECYEKHAEKTDGTAEADYYRSHESDIQ